MTASAASTPSPAPRRRGACTVRRASPRAAVALALLLAALAGCGRDAAAPVTDLPAASAAGAPAVPATPDAAIGSLEAVALEFGTALDADGRVAAVREVVAATDTVYVSLVTVGSAEAAPIAVRWRDAAGTVLAEESHAVSADGPAVHTFTRVPETPWAPGRYEVEVLLGAQSAGVRGFDVR